MTDAEKDERSKSERLFDQISMWIGVLIFTSGMVADLVMGIEVSSVIYATGGSLMVAPKAKDLVKR